MNPQPRRAAERRGTGQKRQAGSYYLTNWLALAQQVDDPGLIGEALLAKMCLDCLAGRGLDAGLGDRAMELEQEARPARVLDRAAMALAICLKLADRFDEARHWFEQTLRAAREEGGESSLPDLLSHLADLECWAGNWAAAERYAAESWETGRQVEHRAWRSIAFYVRALIDVHLGRVDAARAEAEEGLSVATAAHDDWSAMMVSGALGFAELTAGRFEQAEVSLSRAVDLSDRIGLAEPATPTARSPRPCSSARRRWRPTSPASTANWASPHAPSSAPSSAAPSRPIPRPDHRPGRAARAGLGTAAGTHS